MSSGNGKEKNYSDVLIKISDITKRYGKKRVLKGIDLEIKENEKVAIVGGNGAGKTTLLNILSRNDKKFTGEFFVAAKSSEISFQFQTLNYPNEFSLYKLLLMFTVDKDGVNTKDKINDDLKAVDLFEHRKKFPSQLSGGQLQKFNLLMTMATAPKMIFFDEILSGLDQPSITSLIEFIKTRVHGNATTITISHNPNEIYELCDRIIILKNGRISSDDKMEKFSSPDDLERHMRENIIDDDLIDYDKIMVLDRRYENHGDEFPEIFLENIKKWYDLHDVLMGENKEGISAQFSKGESVAIIGRNGSGKSTLAEIIVGAKKASKGKVNLDIYDSHSKTYHNFRNKLDKYLNSSHESKIREEIDAIKHEITVNPKKEKSLNKKINSLLKKIDKIHDNLKVDIIKASEKNLKFNRTAASKVSAIQFQKQFYPSMLNLREVIIYNLQLANIDYDEMYIHYLLECIGLSGMDENSTHSLSGGQRQKLNILLSIIKKPAILVLDELTTGLDLLAKEKLLKLIQQYIEKENPITFIVTHSIEDIEKLANRLILIDEGKITYDESFDSSNVQHIKKADKLLNSLEV